MAQAVDQPFAPVRGAELWPISVEAYHVLGEAGVIPEKTELLYGLVYRKMAKSPYRSFLVRRLVAMLQKLQLRGVFLNTEQPITLGDSEPEPDISVIKGENDQYRTTHPRSAELVIEICVTSHDYDRSKLRAYAKGGIKECWLVLGPEKVIEVFTQPGADSYREVKTFRSAEVVRSSAVPQIEIDPAELF